MIKFALGINISINAAGHIKLSSYTRIIRLIDLFIIVKEFPTPADPSLKLTIDHCCKTSEDFAYNSNDFRPWVAVNFMGYMILENVW